MPVIPSSSSLARNLSAARAASGLTQDQLATLAEVSRATIVQLESADADPQLSTVTKLAQALGISPSLLLLDRADVEAIEEFRAHPGGDLNPSDLDRIEGLIRMQVDKKTKQAASLGAAAVTSTGIAGMTAGAIAGAKAGAAIGTVLFPGLGTIMGGIIGASIAKTLKDQEK